MQINIKQKIFINLFIASAIFFIGYIAGEININNKLLCEKSLNNKEEHNASELTIQAEHFHNLPSVIIEREKKQECTSATKQAEHFHNLPSVIIEREKKQECASATNNHVFSVSDTEYDSYRKRYGIEAEVEKILEQELNVDVENNINFIDFLGKYGSESAVEALKVLAKNQSIEPYIRSAAISSIDWSDDIDSLYSLLTTEYDSQVRKSLVTTANRIEMELQQREDFNKAIYDSLLNEYDDGTITIMFNYFIDKEPEWLLNAYDNFNSMQASPSIKEYIESTIDTSAEQ